MRHLLVVLLMLGAILSCSVEGVTMDELSARLQKVEKAAIKIINTVSTTHIIFTYVKGCNGQRISISGW